MGSAIYRSDHMLLMPAGIVETKQMKDENAWKNVLFLLDTGADSNLTSSPRAALRSHKRLSQLFRRDSTAFPERSTRCSGRASLLSRSPACVLDAPPAMTSH